MKNKNEFSLFIKDGFIYKKCTKCKEVKEINLFYHHKFQKSGYNPSCKACINEINKKWRENNKEKCRKISKEIRLKRLEKEPDFEKKRYYKRKSENPNFLIERREKGRQQYVKHAKKKREYSKAYNQTLHRKQYMRDYHKNRKKIDINYKLRALLSNRMYKALFGLIKKCGSTIEILGCTIEEFKLYLESKFKPGMNWENYGSGAGKWNIDHIKPCSAFNFTDEKQQKECFHFSNTQPLWWEENNSKLDKLPNGELGRHKRLKV